MHVLMRAFTQSNLSEKMQDDQRDRPLCLYLDKNEEHSLELDPESKLAKMPNGLDYDWKKFEFAIFPPKLRNFLSMIDQRQRLFDGPLTQEAAHVLYCNPRYSKRLACGHPSVPLESINKCKSTRLRD